MTTLQQSLRDALQTLRRTSMPIRDIIPLLTKAADRLDELEAALAAQSKVEAPPESRKGSGESASSTQVSKPQDACADCGQPWEDHDFGVPKPFCPPLPEFGQPLTEPEISPQRLADLQGVRQPTAAELAELAAFGSHMRDKTIPGIEQTIAQREAAYRAIRDIPLSAEPAAQQETAISPLQAARVRASANLCLTSIADTAWEGALWQWIQFANVYCNVRTFDHSTVHALVSAHLTRAGHDNWRGSLSQVGDLAQGVESALAGVAPPTPAVSLKFPQGLQHEAGEVAVSLEAFGRDRPVSDIHNLAATVIRRLLRGST